MWLLHDDDLPPGAIDRSNGNDLAVGDDFDAEWALEELLDAHAVHGSLDASLVREVVVELDAAHDMLLAGDRSAPERLRAVIEGIGALVGAGRLAAGDVDELVSLAQAALDMAESLEPLPNHPE